MEKPPHEFQAVEFEGFNLNASVRIDGDDDLARERLMRYGARPPFALERLGRRPNGSITYRIKKLAHGGREKVRVLTPLEFLARLSALIPPPRYPLVRYHGVLAPASKWRCDVVPKPRETNAACKRPVAKAANVKMPLAEVPAAGGAGARRRPSVERAAEASSRPASIATAPDPLPKLMPGVTLLAPNVLSVRHWDRLLGGRLLAPAARVDWANLLQRTFQVDVLACPKCGGRLRVLGDITEAAMVRLVLEGVGFPTEAPRLAPARDPTELLAELDVN